MSDRPPVLSKDTLVPIGVIILLAGGVFWFSTLYSDVQTLKNDRAAMQDQLRSTINTVNGTNERMIRLEAKTDSILEKLDDVKKRLEAQESSAKK